MDLMGKKKKDMPFYIETEGQILSQLISQIISINVLYILYLLFFIKSLICYLIEKGILQLLL